VLEGLLASGAIPTHRFTYGRFLVIGEYIGV